MQTFTAEVGGSLLSVAVSAASVDQNPAGFQLAVTKLQNGQPAEILAISPLQGLSINGRLNDITVLNAVAQFGESGVLLQAQQRYGLLFIADRRPSNFYVFGFQTSDAARQYAAGEILRSVSGASFQSFPPISDLAFAVSVQAIPEPSVLALALFAIAAIWVRVHRH